MKYAVVDLNKYIVSICYGEEIPEGCYEIDYDVPSSPGVNYKFSIDTKTWVYVEPKAPSTNELINDITIKRINLLYQSDWTQIPNNPLTSQQQQDWAAYRQALRDIPNQSGYPNNVIWPTPPQG